MKCIEQNPYRILGLYANCSAKDKAANVAKCKAFLKVGKSVEFPLDALPLPTVQRTEEVVLNAESALALPQDQLRYAQFWFVKATPLDDLAFGYLAQGDMEKACSYWEKQANVSSWQNRMLCALIDKDYARALNCAESLYEFCGEDFAELILDATQRHLAADLGFAFLDTLATEIGVNTLMPYLTNPTWQAHLQKQAVQPILDRLQAAIAVAKAVPSKEADKNLAAGTLLMNSTKKDLKLLRSFLPKTDLQYQTIADKLGLQILQNGINYFNETDEFMAPRKALVLQKYALSIVMGKMAKERCQKNVDIIQKQAQDLPPEEVAQEAQAILQHLHTFLQQPDEIKYAIQLLNNTQPLLLQIKAKLGASNAFYLNLSTRIVNNALGNLITEVNKAIHKDEQYSFYTTDLKNTVRAAWDATVLMETFDMEADFKNDRFLKNRNLLNSLYQRLNSNSTPHKQERKEEEKDEVKKGEQKLQKRVSKVNLTAFFDHFVIEKHFVLYSALSIIFFWVSLAIITISICVLCRTDLDNAIVVCALILSWVLFHVVKGCWSAIVENNGDAFFVTHTKGWFWTWLATLVVAIVMGIVAGCCGGSKSIVKQQSPVETVPIQHILTQKECQDLLHTICAYADKHPNAIQSDYYTAIDGLEHKDSALLRQALGYYQKRKSNKYTESELRRQYPKFFSNAEILEAYDKETEPYKNNSLATGTRPYKNQNGFHSVTGEHTFTIENSRGVDMVVFVKQNGKVADHIYIKSSTSGTMKLPSGTYDVFIYAGIGWSPKIKPTPESNARGGFVSDASMQRLSKQLELQYTTQPYWDPYTDSYQYYKQADRSILRFNEPNGDVHDIPTPMNAIF